MPEIRALQSPSPKIDVAPLPSLVCFPLNFHPVSSSSYPRPSCFTMVRTFVHILICQQRPTLTRERRLDSTEDPSYQPLARHPPPRDGGCGRAPTPQP